MTLNEVEVVLTYIERFDTIGTAALDMYNYLLIQLSQFSADFFLSQRSTAHY